MADGVSPPPKGPKGGLLLNVVRDWDGVAFGESANYNMREQFDSRLKEANNKYEYLIQIFISNIT